MIKLYNTLTRQTDEFKPIRPGKAGMYVCGPTVYWFAHVGNMRSYVFADVVRRALEWDGFDVTLVMNITDVGHLTDDADAGEDKMIVAMRREGKSAADIVGMYTRAFLKDLERLNVEPAAAYPKATEHIPEQIRMVEELTKNGFTYETNDGVYFDTSKLPAYGRLSGQAGADKQAGARVEMGQKKNATDFALWKFSPEGEKRLMEWESPWGKGFPGWHLECSAMSRKYLGVPFDIHTGGVDHIAVHHENEIAQTEGAEGKLEANWWMHGEFLLADGGKMSKSLGNLYTLDDLIAKGYDPLAFRYFCLQAHYRSKLNFTFEALDAAQTALRRLRAAARGWDAPEKESAAYVERFREAVNDDLNLPRAMAVLWELVDDADEPTAKKAASVLACDRVLGLGLDQFVAKRLAIPRSVQALLKNRQTAREAKDFSASDALRDEIAALGFAVEDTPEGQKVREA